MQLFIPKRCHINKINSSNIFYYIFVKLVLVLRILFLLFATVCQKDQNKPPRSALPFVVEGLGVLAVLGLCFGVAAFASGEPAGLIFFVDGGPEDDCCSLLNSNFLLAGS